MSPLSQAGGVSVGPAEPAEPAPGPRSGSLSGPQSGPLLPAVMLGFLVILAFDLSWVLAGLPDLAAGRLLDTDPYTRLLRVEALWEHGRWFDAGLPRLEPDGLIQHWTRLWDAILLAGGAMLAPLFGFQKGLYLFGAFSPLMLHLAALCLFVWAARPVLARDIQWISVFLFLGQVGVLTSFMVGRPDIPPLILTLFIVHTGLILRLLGPTARTRTAVLLGVVSALAVWHTIEAVIFVVPGFGILGLAWLAGRDRQRRVAETAAWTAAVGLLVCLVVERGGDGFRAVEFDRLSLAHVTAFALNAVFWTVLRLAAGRGLAVRAGCAAAAALGVAGALASLFPGFLEGPLAAMDPLYRERRFQFISEYKGVFQPERGVFAGLVVLPALLLLLPLVGGVWAILVRPWRQTETPWTWLYLLGLFGLVVVLTVGAIHWAGYLGVLTALIVTHPVARLLARLERAPLLLQSLARVGLILALVVLPLAPWLGGAWLGATGIPEKRSARQDCFPQELFTVLNDPGDLGDRRRLILAHTDSGPELLYRTRHAVLSIPNHRPQAGFRTALAILSAADAQEARRQIEAAGVDLIMLCAGNAGERPLFVGSRSAGTTLYDRLDSGDPPAFLQPVPLPDPVAGGPVRLFRVLADRS